MCRSRSQIQRILCLSVAPIAALAGSALAQTAAFDLSSLSHIGPITYGPTIFAYPLNSPPLEGFVPQLVYQITDEHSPDDFSFEAHPSTTPGGYILPDNINVHYATAVLDSGASAHIVRWQDADLFDFGGAANRLGAYPVSLKGAGTLTETADITDAVGIYVASFKDTTRFTGTPIITGPVIGQTNTAIITTRESANSIFPSLVGTPLMAQHQTLIKNSETYRLKVGSETLRSPHIQFSDPEPDLNAPTPAGFSRFATTDALSANGLSPQPVYFPSFDNFDDFTDNPSSPTFWANLYTHVDLQHHNDSNTPKSTGDQFLFDTGAQVSVLSTSVANSLGIKTGNDPTPWDFEVDITGVGGHRDKVKGYYIDSLTLTTDNNDLVFTHVPVIIANFTDPRDNSGSVPGILGMNLFNDRNIIINGGLDNPFIAVSTNPFTPKWNKNASGAWGEDASWILGVPDAPDAPANFPSSATAQAINVDADYTVGSITFDSPAAYTLFGAGHLNLQTTAGPASIHVVAGAHVITAPLIISSDASIAVDPPLGSLRLSSLTNTGKSLTKSGPGTVIINGPQINSPGSTFNANGGTTDFNTDAGSTTSALLGVTVAATLNFKTTQHLASVAIASTGKVNLGANGSRMLVTNSLSIASGGALDLADNDLVVVNGAFSTIQNLVFTGYRSGVDSTATGIVSTTAQVDNGNEILIVFDNALAGISDWPQGSGDTVAANAIIGKYTYLGDFNIDGQVTPQDYTSIDSNLGTNNIPLGVAWFYGDGNFDGNITAQDYTTIDSALGLGVGQPLTVQAVPEPLTLSPLFLPIALSIRRRRKFFSTMLTSTPDGG
jgi:hypothetical protein